MMLVNTCTKRLASIAGPVLTQLKVQLLAMHAQKISTPTPHLMPVSVAHLASILMVRLANLSAKKNEMVADLVQSK